MTNRPYIFISPSKYVQGAGAVLELGVHVRPLGVNALVIGGKTGLAVTREGRERSFREHGIRQTEAPFGGESSDAEIARLTRLARAELCDVVIACGGGKAIDTAKAVADAAGLPVAIVPTVASNDSPCSALSVIYRDDGSFDRIQTFKRNPDLVLVDTAVIARSPVRQLVSGMGDALATWYEARACLRSGALNVSGGAVTLTAAALARLCRDTLFENGPDAVAACRDNVVTPALDRVVEANTLLSGLGFESAGVALAHALSEAFSCMPCMHAYTHGEKVAFGLLVQLVLEGVPEDELGSVYSFCREVGLPTTLAELGADGADAISLRIVAETAAEPGRPSGNLPFPVTADSILQAMTEADAFGRTLAGVHNDGV
ncbi:MAG: glycerol dehydrogenase [Oscillospiraceae bacterium]|jgi:glycerol dehydrogenase|nr:glycerol dehydrogenase [Oscillospiraceae bacterium]